MEEVEHAVEKKILSVIGNRVRFKYPGSEGERNGVLADRTVDRANPDETGVPYWSVVDLIEFREVQGKWIRFGYYRRPHEDLNWASQTAATFPMESWKRLFVKTARQKPWFRELLQRIIDELDDEGSDK